MSELEEQMRAAVQTFRQIGEAIAASQVPFPELLERAVALGYRGHRSGWYPAKPKGWRP